MRRLIVVAGAVALTLASLPVDARWAAMPTLARFVDSAGSTGSWIADTLDPPTAVAATAGPGTVSLTWTPTADAYAAGYDLQRSSSAAGPFATIALLTPRTAASASDSPGPGTWYYRLRTTFQAWASGPSTLASATVIVATTGSRACTTNAAVSGGDDDGYEILPARACLADGLAAEDRQSGSNKAANCNNSGKDRHRFWDFALGVPVSASSIQGVEVRLVGAATPLAGITEFCVQLSWNAGTTWTTAQSLAVTATSLRTYGFGGPADVWGRTWTPALLADPAFQVRVTDVADATDRTFLLDGVAVSVTYLP